MSRKRKYGFFNGLFDILMVLLTGGLWLIWIAIKFMRKNS